MPDDTLTGLDEEWRGRLPRPGRSLSSGAIYHLSVRTSSRAKGQSARAAAAYIQRAAEYRRDQGAELVYTESGHLPGWAEGEPTAYWDAADKYERANGRLCKRLEFALPVALTEEERRELAIGFAHHLTDGERLPYTLAIHAGNGTNPHCHLMISERGNDGLERSPAQWFRRYNAAEPAKGGARKSEALKPRAWFDATRAAWAAQANQALERAGHEVRIDHRSLEEQGIARVAGVHLGPAAAAMEARGVESVRGAEARADRQALQEEVEHERKRTRREPEREPGRPGVEREGEGDGRDAGRLAGGRGGERGAGLAGGGRAGRDTPGGASGEVGREAGRRGPAPASPDRPAQPGGPQSARGAHLAAGGERAVAAGLEPGPVAGGGGERGDSAARELGRGGDLRGGGAVSTPREEERAAARERRQERLLAMIEGKVERSRQQAREQEQEHERVRRRERERERQRSRDRQRERERDEGLER